MPRRQAETLDTRSEGHTGDQMQVVSVRVQMRNEVRGSRSSFRADGSTVARMVELVSCFSGLSDHDPLLVRVVANLEVRWGTVVLFEKFCS